MRLNPPKFITWLISLICAVIGILIIFSITPIRPLAPYVQYIVLGGLVLLLLGSVVRGL
jgi:predicted membrane channel-forming protein YqfA (hemolysin III family)